jgi:hypothetical protein
VSRVIVCPMTGVLDPLSRRNLPTAARSHPGLRGLRGVKVTLYSIPIFDLGPSFALRGIPAAESAKAIEKGDRTASLCRCSCFILRSQIRCRNAPTPTGSRVPSPKTSPPLSRSRTGYGGHKRVHDAKRRLQKGNCVRNFRVDYGYLIMT